MGGFGGLTESSRFQGFEVSEVSEVSRFQSFKVSESQGFRVSRFQSLKVSEFQGFGVSRFRSFKVSRKTPCGCRGALHFSIEGALKRRFRSLKEGWVG